VFNSGIPQIINSSLIINTGSSTSNLYNPTSSGNSGSNYNSNFTNVETIQPVIVVSKSESKGTTTELVLSVVIPLLVLIVLGIGMFVYIRTKKLKLRAERMGKDK